ncbi:MAG: Ig-like domain-containing protein [Parahaliea sp.]
MITRFATLTSRLTAFFVILLALGACGGGGSSGGGGGFIPDGSGDGSTTTNGPYTLTLTLRNSSGQVTNSLTGSAPATLSVRVRETGGGNVQNALVTASSEFATVSPETALTNADGIATFTVTIAEAVTGAGTISVEVSNSDGESSTADINLQIEKAGLRLGYLVDGVFLENVIGVVPETALVYGGSAELIIDIVDEEGKRASTTETVNITSNCIASGDAILDPQSPVAITGGHISVTYSATNCQGSDDITASLHGGSSGASASLGIGSIRANGLNFISVEHELIVLRGTGGGSTGRTESTLVTFQVVNGNNAPMQGIPVNFALSTTTGGLNLARNSAVSDGEGMVSTTVNSGDIPTTVRVIATIEATDNNSEPLSTVSAILAVTTGLPDQNSISLSVEGGFIVDGGMTKDGVERTIIVRMADKFNNPVTDGTAAVFTTEFGTIDGSCITGVSNGERAGGTPASGQCSVLWTSGNPRYPDATFMNDAIQTIYSEGYSCHSHNGTYGPCPEDLGATPPARVNTKRVHPGRTTILVTAIGEESFIDRNGDGIFNQEENFTDNFVNLPEAWVDHNENHIYDPAYCGNSRTGDCLTGFEETFVDFGGESAADVPDGGYNFNDQPALYNGLLCPRDGDGIWCSRKLLNVSDSIILTMSQDNQFGITVATPPTTSATGQVTAVSSSSGQIAGSVETDIDYVVYVADLYNYAPAGDSTITVEGINNCTIQSSTSVSVPYLYYPGAFSFNLRVSNGGFEEGKPPMARITLNPLNASAVTWDFPCS